MKAKFILIAFLLGTVMLNSCEKDKKTELENTGLRGYWVFSKYILKEGIELDYHNQLDFYNFFSDNEMAFRTTYAGSGGATYYARNQGLVIAFSEDAGGNTQYTYKIDGNTLRLEYAASSVDNEFVGYILVRAK